MYLDSFHFATLQVRMFSPASNETYIQLYFFIGLWGEESYLFLLARLGSGWYFAKCLLVEIGLSFLKKEKEKKRPNMGIGL